MASNRGNTLKEFIKARVYRSKLFGRLVAPTYPYALDPSQLAWLIHAVQKTGKMNGDIVEIGVARGMTSVFMNTCLKNIHDTRRYVCIDTFGGFVEDDIAYEVKHRSKKRRDYNGFAYNDEAIFKKNMKRLGFDNVITIATDVNEYKFTDIKDISLALIDVDLYQPTKNALRETWKRLQKGGAIMIDDVQTPGIFDGAREAYDEFCRMEGVTGEMLPEEGAIIWK